MSSKLSASIKAGLAMRGVSQSTLADVLGVSGNSVTSWVKDRHLPDKESLKDLAEYLDWDATRVELLLEDWFQNEYGKKQYRLAGYEFVNQRYGGDYIAFLDDLIALDEAAIAGISHEHEGTSGQWAPIFLHSPYTWKLIISEDEIVGYWHFFCMRDEPYNRVRRGELIDSELTVEMLDFPVIAGRYKAYFPVLAVRAQDRSPTTLNMLTASFAKTLLEFTKNQIFFEEFCVCAFSFEGKRMCELVGMQYKLRHPRAVRGELADIFTLQGADVAESYWGKNRIVADAYRREFNTK